MVKWICPKNPCGCHIYDSTINCRTRKNPTGCPYCVNHKLCPHNNLEAVHPELKEEWSDKNEKRMNEYSPNSGNEVWWKCKFGHEWETVIDYRTGKDKTGCPHCVTHKYSKAQIKWLTNIEKEENIYIQHAVKSEGEYHIPTIGKVDGFCEETNTVYEYHGDFWHGNPLIHKPEDINPRSKISYGDLYKNTLLREQKIRDLGYNLVVKWKTELVKS
jgi:hypothetical protein